MFFGGELYRISPETAWLNHDRKGSELTNADLTAEQNLRLPPSTASQPHDVVEVLRQP
jgi:hypothetical protein